MLTLTLTIKHASQYQTMPQWNAGETVPDYTQILPPGTQVEYMAHLAGGMVKVRHEGQAVVIHPGGTEELS